MFVSVFRRRCCGDCRAHVREPSVSPSPQAALRSAVDEGERAFGRGAQPTFVFTAALALHLR